MLRLPHGTSSAPHANHTAFSEVRRTGQNLVLASPQSSTRVMSLHVLQRWISARAGKLAACITRCENRM
jgi:hypothetical protein